MITPEQIRSKGLRKYKPYLREWIRSGDAEAFPMVISGDRRLPEDDGEARQALERLFAHAKQSSRLFGYSIDWRFKHYRHRGRNRAIERIYFETREDWLKTIGKFAAFQRTERVASRLRAAFPLLEQWLEDHVTELEGYEPQLDGLIEVTQYFLAHPRPGLYVRQLPLSVDTKFIQRNERVLRQWFDILLPGDAVNSVGQTFAARYGLREIDQYYRLRLLDPSLQTRLNMPVDELALPLHRLADFNWSGLTCVIAENKESFHSLPPHPNAIAIWGEGNAVQRFADLRWLHDCAILYWGDIDVAGFQILASFRQRFTNVTSFLMDINTIEQCRECTTDSVQPDQPPPPLLTEGERAAQQWVVSSQKRLEQERIPQPYVDEMLRWHHIGPRGKSQSTIRDA